MKEEISVVVTLHHASVDCVRLLTSLSGQCFQDVCFYLCCEPDDNLQELVQTKTHNDERFCIIQTDCNLALSRNQVLAQSKGSYVSFLDESDWVHSQWLTILHRLITSSVVDIAMSYRGGFQEAREVIEHMHPHAHIQRFSAKQASKSLYSNWELHMGRLRGKLFARSLFEHTHFDPTTLHVDEAILYRLLYDCKGVICTTQPLLYGGSATSGDANSFASEMSLLAVYQQRAKFYEEVGELELVLKTKKAMFPIHKRLMHCFDGLRAEEKLAYLEENQAYLRMLSGCRLDLWFSHISKKELHHFLRSHQSVTLWGE